MVVTPDTTEQTFSSKRADFVKPPKPDIPLDPEYWAEKRRELGVPEFGYSELIDVQALIDKFGMEKIGMKPRGSDVAIPSGGLQERFNDYLRMLMFVTGEPIQLQFIAQQEKDAGLLHATEHTGYLDPLEEEKYRVKEAPALIWKYQHESSRALFTVTDICSASCMHCTRGRDVNKKGSRPEPKEEIDKAIAWLRKTENVREVIISGGDPFTLSKEAFLYLTAAAGQLVKDDCLDYVRIGSRRLIQTGSLPDYIYRGLEQIKNPNIMHHYNHPWEITKQVQEGLDKLDAVGATMYSQTVLLAKVNDDREVMKALFRKGKKNRILPYYVFLCDEVSWGKKFVVPFSQVKKIFHRLSSELNGLEATAQVVIDVAGGVGKIRLDSGYWDSEDTFEDNHGNPFRITEQGYVIPLNKEPQILKPKEQEITLFQGGLSPD